MERSLPGSIRFSTQDPERRGLGFVGHLFSGEDRVERSNSPELFKDLFAFSVIGSGKFRYQLLDLFMPVNVSPNRQVLQFASYFTQWIILRVKTLTQFIQSLPIELDRGWFGYNGLLCCIHYTANFFYAWLC
jgi:hypothetical protein